MGVYGRDACCLQAAGAQVTAAILAELSDLFSLESLEADLRNEFIEAERLHDISDELHKRCGAALAREHGCAEVT